MSQFLFDSSKNIFIQNVDQPQSNDLIRRSGSSTTTLHHHCPPDTTPKVRTIKRDMNHKITRKDYEIKTLKQVYLIPPIISHIFLS
jgi:hypothetical protein